MIPLAYALDECQRITEPSDIPCFIISSYHPSEITASSTCQQYNVTIYNSTGGIVFDYITFGDYPPYCNATFNITTTGTYIWNSSLESGVINVEAGKMWIAAILLLPLGLCFLFVYLASTLDDVHNPIKWFFRLLALIMIFVVYQGAHIITELNPGYEDLANMFSITVYGWIFWVIMVYFLIYIIYNIFMSFKHNREWDFNEAWIK